MNKNSVFVKHCSDLTGKPYHFSQHDLENLVASLRPLLAAFPAIEKQLKQAHVLIKPNLVRPNLTLLPAMTTDPRLILALVRLCHEYQARKVSVGEKPGFGFPARKAFQLTGIEDYSKSYDFDTIYFDEEPWVRTENPEADFFRNPLIPQAALECDLFINLPKMKTHMHTLVSLGLKNCQGLVA
ncbi:DUF362 domain-containing protein, partial [candidate division CSSED10-310 bacterium]